MTSSVSARVLARTLIGLFTLTAIIVVGTAAALADDTVAPAATTVPYPPEKAGVGVVDSETGQWWLRDPVSGESTRFYTCSASDMTAKQLIDFLAARGKFVSASGGFSTDPTKICDH